MSQSELGAMRLRLMMISGITRGLVNFIHVSILSQATAAPPPWRYPVGVALAIVIFQRVEHRSLEGTCANDR